MLDRPSAARVSEPSDEKCSRGPYGQSILFVPCVVSCQETWRQASNVNQTDIKHRLWWVSDTAHHRSVVSGTYTDLQGPLGDHRGHQGPPAARLIGHRPHYHARLPTSQTRLTHLTACNLIRPHLRPSEFHDAKRHRRARAVAVVLAA